MISLGPQLADWARTSEALLQQSLASPSPGTVAVVFAGGLLTSLGPCSLSLLPVTLAYLAGFSSATASGAMNTGASASQDALPRQTPWLRSLSFAGGIVAALVLLGLVSGLLGRIYGQIPGLIPTVVAVLALLMGLNLLGLLKVPLPAGPDPEVWRRRVPAPLAPMAAGLAFGLAATPCTTPVLAVLLAWMAQNGKPLVGMLLLTSFGAGQVVPLLLAGTAAASLPHLLSLRRVGQWVPPISGVVLVTTGALTLVANWR
ncbi:sulfite exporter TauE/SafE family protein [Cyanobium sp. Aljojuca 7D2]|jgi:cytochrome c-type biogenesis protein|uniref:cytochrome c biogenesis protein CcdA n=1 Tax=Cyanobium sp. Aljojuca 7D2 TaxID=2823698 RepID=UPI0020CC1959|nr:cytochrome c biogenesis protein CcdA [Cyanobium sp. Aljojuca 7D2]MCP9891335.1 sulfite exporter TauE/SafE family protein [Cyanobium sp. Aljojuca 7D2]